MNLIKITHKKEFKFSRLGLPIITEWSDTKKGLYFRLGWRNKRGEWQSSYGSFAQLEVDGRQFRLGTQYWSNSAFTPEVPFEIIHGE
jgi:hypothetical protein